MKLYHATSTNYQAGSDLLSLQAQIERGWLSEAEALELVGRWEADDSYLHEDGTMVSLTADRAEAERVLEEFNGGQGSILEVDGEALEADGLLRKNAEGYPAVYSSIPSYYIKQGA